MNEATTKKEMIKKLKCACCGEQLTLASFRNRDQWWVCWKLNGEGKIVDILVACRHCRCRLDQARRITCDLEMNYFAGFRGLVRFAEYVDQTTPETRPVLLDICFNAQALPTCFAALTVF